MARAARAALALAVAGTAVSAVNGAMYEPPEGQVMLGFWFDPANRKSAAALRAPIDHASPSPEDGTRHGSSNPRLALFPA